ncbi:MAG: hypothetical protein IRZ02_03945 [Acidothermus sp.]|nr:hypothetical protein [Acidothermus sp.]MCL6537156.1 carboxypeptidase-like regulatory domain-containing protein [Acidothermus sp.]
MNADEKLIGLLRAALEQVDPLPQTVRSAARAVLTWRTLDAELAELVEDASATEASTVAAVRSSDGPRLLTFRAENLEVEVEVGGDRRRSITGQLIPPGPASIVIRWDGGSVTTLADELGCFSADDLPPGLIRLEIRRAGSERAVVTSWTAI